MYSKEGWDKQNMSNGVQGVQGPAVPQSPANVASQTGGTQGIKTEANPAQSMPSMTPGARPNTPGVASVPGLNFHGIKQVLGRPAPGLKGQQPKKPQQPGF